MLWRKRFLFLTGFCLACSPAGAVASGVELLSADTFALSGDIRLIAGDGESSWLRDGFGKTRYGNLQAPAPGNFDLAWTPRLGWSLSATIVASAVGGPRPEAGLSEAFLSFRSPPGDGLRWFARAGLMFSPVSLEHSGANWHVTSTVTPSAINSWIGEEVKPLAIEGRVEAPLGAGRIEATVASFAANDTAGALLALRGWALNDRKTFAFRRQPLPQLGEELEYLQPRFTHPLLDVGPGFAHRPGYYAKLAWASGGPLRVELFHYDNRADPEDVNADLEWGWRTRFDQLGVAAQPLAGTEIKAQAMRGHSTMGMIEDGRRWVDHRFRSAFVLVDHHWSRFGVAARGEAFDGRQHGSLVDGEDNEQGWAGTLCGRMAIGTNVNLLVEALHVDSRRSARERIGLAPRQKQDQLQAVLHASW